LLLAATVLVAASLGFGAWVFRVRAEALARLGALEHQIAMGGAEKNGTEETSFSVLDQLSRVAVESSVAEMTALAEVHADKVAPLREILLAKATITVEMMGRATPGGVDVRELVRIDTFSGLDREFQAALDERDYEAVTSRLARHSQEVSEQSVRDFLGDLRRSVPVSESESKRLETFLLERTAWRRDVAFFPPFLLRELCVCLLWDGKALSKQVLDVVRPEQVAQVVAFLDRSEAGYRQTLKHLGRRS
jgi:hypothetical protein